MGNGVGYAARSIISGGVPTDLGTPTTDLHLHEFGCGVHACVRVCGGCMRVNGVNECAALWCGVMQGEIASGEECVVA